MIVLFLFVLSGFIFLNLDGRLTGFAVSERANSCNIDKGSFSREKLVCSYVNHSDDHVDILLSFLNFNPGENALVSGISLNDCQSYPKLILVSGKPLTYRINCTALGFKNDLKITYTSSASGMEHIDRGYITII
jgi:hypothetical protein